MDWKERRGKWQSTSEDSQIDYVIIPKKNSRYFIKAYLGGGAEHRLPFQDFASPEAAKAWWEILPEMAEEAIRHIMAYQAPEWVVRATIWDMWPGFPSRRFQGQGGG